MVSQAAAISSYLWNHNLTSQIMDREVCFWGSETDANFGNFSISENSDFFGKIFGDFPISRLGVLAVRRGFYNSEFSVSRGLEVGAQKLVNEYGN